MQNSQLIKFINGVSKKSFVGAEQYMNEWSSWLADQKWATVTDAAASADAKLLEIHREAINQLARFDIEAATTPKRSKTASLGGSGEFIAEIWESESASEPEFRKRCKHGAAAQDWAFAKVAEFGGSDWFVKITDSRGKVSTYTRNYAIGMAWGKRKASPATRKVGVSSAGWQMRARNDRASFSRG